MSQRTELKPYVGKRLVCSGYYGTSSYLPQHEHTVSIQDIEIAADDQNIYVPYAWVQRANLIIRAKPRKGDRVKFTAMIHTYSKRQEDGSYASDYGLSNPADNEFPDRDYYPPQQTFALPVATPAVTVSKQSTLEIVGAVKEIVKAINAETITAVIPHIKSIQDAVAKCGGEEEFLSLVKLLS